MQAPTTDTTIGPVRESIVDSRATITAIRQRWRTAAFSTKMKAIMQTGATKSAAVRALILQALGQRPYRPTELLEQFQSREISEAQLKDELAALMNELWSAKTPSASRLNPFYVKSAGAKALILQGD